jgi:hypothetical protein
LNAPINPRSGKFADLDEICRRLRSDGYQELYLHFEGRSALQADLSRICRRAQGRAEPANGKPPRYHTQQLPAQRFEFKAAVCRRIADNAQSAETRQMYLQLAVSYEEATAGECEKERSPPPKTTRS